MNDLSDKEGKLSMSLVYKTKPDEKQMRITINLQWKTIFSIAAAVVLVGMAVVGWLIHRGVL